MNEKEFIKVRLLRPHYMNGVKKNVGSVLRLEKAVAEWLIGLRRAKVVK